MNNVELYNYNRTEPLFNLNTTSNKIYLNNINDFILIDKLNTNNFKLKLIRFILCFSLRRIFRISKKGVIVKKGVTKKLDYLIAGVNGGSKVVKAQSLNIPILGKIALENFLGIRYDYGEFDGTELSEDELIF